MWGDPHKAEVFLGSPVAASCGGRPYPQPAGRWSAWKPRAP